MRLCVMHNLFFYNRLMENIRKAIEEDRYPQFKEEFHIPGRRLLPHRDPFLFVDELISADETGALGRYTYTDPATAIPGKAVNTFFEGHFPTYPVVPGVVLIESMAQVAGAAIATVIGQLVGARKRSGLPAP